MNINNQIEIEKFDLKCLRNRSNISLIISSHKKNKFLLSQILISYKDIDIIVINPNEKKDPFYYKFVPCEFIHDEYSDDLIDQIWMRQKMLVHTNSRKKLLLILDHCSKDINLSNFQKIIYNNRFVNLSIIILDSYNIQLPLQYYLNIDYTFLGYKFEDFEDNWYFRCCEIISPNIFYNMVNKYVKDDYSYLIIDGTTGALKNYQEHIYWYSIIPKKIKKNFYYILCYLNKYIINLPIDSRKTIFDQMIINYFD
jgi:hypothetical protein